MSLHFKVCLGNMVIFIRPFSQISLGVLLEKQTLGSVQSATCPGSPSFRAQVPQQPLIRILQPTGGCVPVHTRDLVVCLDSVSPTSALLVAGRTLKSRSFSQSVYTALPVDLGCFTSNPAGKLHGRALRRSSAWLPRRRGRQDVSGKDPLGSSHLAKGLPLMCSV